MQKLCIALAAALLATACHPHDLASHGGDRQPVSLGGVTLSSVAQPAQRAPGSPLTGAAAGSAISAGIHPRTLQALDLADRAHLERAVLRSYSLQTGQSVEWESAETTGRIILRDVQTSDGRPCRVLRHEIAGPDRGHQAMVTACQQADGTWTRVVP